MYSRPSAPVELAIDSDRCGAAEDVVLLLVARDDDAEAEDEAPADVLARGFSACDSNASAPGKGYSLIDFFRNFAARSLSPRRRASAPILRHFSASSLLTCKGNKTRGQERNVFQARSTIRSLR